MRQAGRLLQVVLGAALAAAGVSALVELTAVVLGAGPLLVPAGRWLDSLRETQLADPASRLVFGIAVALGLVLLLAQVRPSPGRQARLEGAAPGAWWVPRASAEQYVRRAVLRGTEATGARARLTPGTRRWKVRVDADGPTAIRPQVERQVWAALDQMGAPQRSAVVVRVRRARRAR
jgi:hypothetical protein